MLKIDSFKNSIQRLKKEGYLDWQILQILRDLAIGHRLKIAEIGLVNTTNLHKDKINACLYHEETIDDPEIPYDVFSDKNIDTQKTVSDISPIKTWQLSITNQCPDIKAIKKFLDVRCRQSVDDIEHNNYFGI